MPAGTQNWTRSRRLFPDFLSPARICAWSDGSASVEFFFHRHYSRLSISGMKATCAANFWFRFIWIRLSQEHLECRNEGKNLVFWLAVDLYFPLFPEVVDELYFSSGRTTRAFKHTKILICLLVERVWLIQLLLSIFAQ